MQAIHGARVVRSSLVLICLLWPIVSALGDYNIRVRGDDEKSYEVKDAKTWPVDVDPKLYDVIVVGSGLAGLTATFFLSDRNLSVLLVEKEPIVGGLAMGGGPNTSHPYARGSAYWTDAFEEEREIMHHLGIFSESYAIYDPIDSYFWNHTLYEDMWGDAAMKALPASFPVFKYELVHAFDDGLLPDQPLEEYDRTLDQMNIPTWIRSMPETIARHAKAGEEDAQKLYTRFQNDPRIKELGPDPMRDVIDLMERFAPSAMGTVTSMLSAVNFGNFYISEIDTRYSTPQGTGGFAKVVAHQLMDRMKAGTVDVRTNAPVVSVRNVGLSAEVDYARVADHRLTRVRSRFGVVWCAQLRFIPQILESLPEKDPQRVKAINSMKYAHYSVHVATLKGHPFRSTYDTWINSDLYTPPDGPTDLIMGRWMELKGYDGYRDFTKDPPDDVGYFTIYDPLGLDWVGKGYTPEQVIKRCTKSVDQILATMGPFIKQQYGQDIHILEVETTRWPYSVHIVEPGHFTTKAQILKRPFGNVYFGTSEIGTASFEEALFRGHCAANNLLHRINPAFQQEKWSRCVFDKSQNDLI